MTSRINSCTCIFKVVFFVVFLSVTNTSIAVGNPIDSTHDLPDTRALDDQLRKSEHDPLGLKRMEMDFQEDVEASKSRMALQQYYRENLVHRKNTFSWQYSSGIIIFYIVILVVLSGVVYAGIQFYQSIREMKIKEEIIKNREAINLQIANDMIERRMASEEKNMTPLQVLPVQMITDAKTEMEFSATGFKLNSSLVGIIILVISIAFFYLYLVHVYPINQMKIDVEQQRQDLKEKRD